jgi:hypothetical protein
MGFEPTTTGATILQTMQNQHHIQAIPKKIKHLKGSNLGDFCITLWDFVARTRTLYGQKNSCFGADLCTLHCYVVMQARGNLCGTLQKEKGTIIYHARGQIALQGIRYFSLILRV